MPRIDTILVPVDFSASSRAALAFAIGTAKALGAPALHLVHTYTLPLGTAPPYPITIPEAVHEEIKSSASRALDELKREVEAAGLRACTHVLCATPSEGIEALAGELGADLIVIGTRGLSGIKHVLLGSVAERTVRAAPCPVITVRADAG